MRSPFTDNTTYQIQHVDAAGEHEVVGHVFACPSSSSGVDQEQRWVLRAAYFKVLQDIMGGVRREDWLIFRIPPLAHRYTSLEAWTTALKDSVNRTGFLWQDGATYVKVNTKNYAAVPTIIEPPPDPYPSLSSARASAKANTSPTLLPRRDETQIIDDMVTEIFRVEADGTSVGQGFACGGALSAVTDELKIRYNVEYWVTDDHYVSQLGDGVPRLRLKLSWMPRLADNFVKSKWEIGSTFTVATCAYLTEVPANP